MPETPIHKNDAYMFAVQKALFAFQMVEEALKLNIQGSYEFIKRSISSPVVFNFELSAISDAPLGNLIKQFAKVSSNEPLIADLRKVEQWRNFCAHRAFAHEFLSRQSGASVSDKEVEEVKEVAAFAVKLVVQLGNDLRVLQEALKRKRVRRTP